MELGYFNSYMEVDLGIIARNYRRVQAHIGPGHGIIPVVKANAYGHGTVEIAGFYIQNFGPELMGVGQLMEGVQIRQAGYRQTDILVMGGLPPHLIDYAVEYDLQTALFDIPSADLLNRAAAARGRLAQAQIKIETGMNRIGALPGDELEALIRHVKTLEHVEITGVFTHFSTATLEGEPFVREQYGMFQKGLEQVKAAWPNLRYIHCCNTGATYWFPEGYHTHIRVGCAVMGYAGMDDFTNPLNLTEPASWRAFITNLRQVQPGQSVGYSRHFKVRRPTRVATIDVGYGDGLYRPMVQQGGPVIVGETRSRYLACAMDQAMVDATDIDCAVGDEVTIYGRSRGGTALTFNEIDAITGQSVIYPIQAISPRVKRIYIHS